MIRHRIQCTHEVRSSLQWRHNECDGVLNHQPHGCLLNHLFRHRWKKHQSSASMAFVWGIHRWPTNSQHKGPVMRKMFPFDDVIMWLVNSDVGRQAADYQTLSKNKKIPNHIFFSLSLCSLIHLSMSGEEPYKVKKLIWKIPWPMDELHKYDSELNAKDMISFSSAALASSGLAVPLSINWVRCWFPVFVHITYYYVDYYCYQDVFSVIDKLHMELQTIWNIQSQTLGLPFCF